MSTGATPPMTSGTQLASSESTNQERLNTVSAGHSNTVIKYNYGKQDKEGIDKNTEVFLRLAIVDNPTFNRPSPVGMDPTEVDGVVNENTGKVCLKWLGMGGGVVTPESNATYFGKRTSYNSEDRSLDEVSNNSTQEIVELTYPFMWVGPGNWCGYNYLPPIGAKVIVGFSKNGLPQILGYLNPSYKSCAPYLKPGEICNKGYGNNYIHNRWSNKLDLKAWSTNGSQDIDDPAYEKCSTQDYTLWIRMDADNGHIVISANSTSLLMTPDNISMTVGGTSVFSVTNDSISLTTGTLSINAQSIDNNGAAVHHN